MQVLRRYPYQGYAGTLQIPLPVSAVCGYSPGILTGVKLSLWFEVFLFLCQWLYCDFLLFSLLLKNGAVITQNDDGQTSLHKVLFLQMQLSLNLLF